jgi:hypothetical protein
MELASPQAGALVKLMTRATRSGDAKRAWCLLNIAAYLVERGKWRDDGAGATQLRDMFVRFETDVRESYAAMARDKLYACVDPRNSLGVALEYSDLYPLLLGTGGR